MSQSADRLVWIDCEMTGLELQRDALIEVAVIVTDAELTPLGEGLDVIIHAADDVLDTMVPFVAEMHAKSGLTTAVRESGVTLGDAEQQVLEYIRRFVPLERSAPLGGNTIGTDRTFLARYMPAVDQHLHYRSIDVSSIKELARRWYPRIYFNAPEKAGGHRALADILESIRELHFYRKAAFVAPPGPSSEEVQAISAAVVAEFAPRL